MAKRKRKRFLDALSTNNLEEAYTCCHQLYKERNNPLNPRSLIRNLIFQLQ